MSLETVNLPLERTVPILTTHTDEWIPPVANALVAEERTALIQCGDGPYILVGGVHVGRTGPEILQLINRQKERSLNQLAALGIPREEMSDWVVEDYRPLVEHFTSVLKDEVFGLIAPVNDRVPNWLLRYDRLHRTWEKLMVWTDKTDTGPTARLYRYFRTELGLSADEFFLIATSANTHRKGTNIRFAQAYEQLGDKDGLAYAVMDVEEEKYTKRSPPIISALPFVKGRNYFKVENARRGIEGISSKVPNLRNPSRFGRILYATSLRFGL